MIYRGLGVKTVNSDRPGPNELGSSIIGIALALLQDSGQEEGNR